MFTGEQLRSLATYLMAVAADLDKKSKEKSSTPLPNVGSGDPAHVTDDDVHAVRSLARQLEAIGYDPILFESLVEDYNLNVGSLEGPIENAPLHINDESAVEQAVVKWRLENAV